MTVFFFFLFFIILFVTQRIPIPIGYNVIYLLLVVRNLLDARDYILIFLIVSVRKQRMKPVSRDIRVHPSITV